MVHRGTMFSIAGILILMVTIPISAGNETNSETVCVFKDIDSRLSIALEIIETAKQKLKQDLKQTCLEIPCDKKLNCSECGNDTRYEKPIDETVCDNITRGKILNCSECGNGTFDNTPIDERVCQNITCDTKPLDCNDIFKKGFKSGTYEIWPQSRISEGPLDVYCDMSDGGGWTVIQKRGDFGNPEDFFYRGWNEYKKGFGDLKKEFWIGNNNLFAITNQRSYQIKFDLWDLDNKFKYAIYNAFWVDDESQGYKLHVGVVYNGTAGNSFGHHNGMSFSTKDKDNDASNNTNCAITYEAAWWYNSCHRSNLNGPNKKTKLTNVSKQMSWQDVTENKFFPLKATKMKIRPLASS